MSGAAFDVTFRVKAKVQAGETVCVVGNCPELGNWMSEKAVPLKLEGTDGDYQVWSKLIKLPFSCNAKYRYLIAHICESQHEGDEDDIMVRQWETNILPRTFSVKAYCMSPHDCSTFDSTFGFYGGRQSIDKGWLTGQTEIHIRFYNNPLKLWKTRHRQQTYSIKCIPMDLRYKDSEATSDSENEEVMMDEDESNHDIPAAGGSNVVYVSVLNGREDIPSIQPQFGCIYRENDYMLFRAQSFEPEFLGFQFDIYMHSGDNDTNNIPQLFGTSYLLPVNMKDSNGQKFIPITGRQNKPIGEMEVEYMLIKPLRSCPQNMKVSYSHHWKHQRGPVDIGHRGLGNSYTTKKCAAVRENTLLSLSEAGGHGADFVEFDIQLSSDNVPVVYHDFLVGLTLKKRVNGQMEFFEIPVQDLSLAKLQALKVDHISKVKTGEPDNAEEDEDPFDRQPFPTLQQVFENLDPHIGFNMEIKYPQKTKTGELEEGLKHFMERNKYIDIILKQALQYAGERRIIFSCFDADICTMIRLKQNRYPVMFLCLGDTPKYEPYQDMRTRNVPISASFVHCEQLLGVNPQSDNLLANLELITQIKDMGLVLFCWGELNNDRDNIRILKEKGVDGVIYDLIHELKGSKENIFKMEHAGKLELLKQCGALSSSEQMSFTSPGKPAEAGTSCATCSHPDASQLRRSHSHS